jgi:hypothetical protein
VSFFDNGKDTMFARAHAGARVTGHGSVTGRSSVVGRLALSIALCAFAVLPSRLAQAQYEIETGHAYGEIETPRITAVAGAIRSTSSSTAALFANPANMALAQVYHFGALAEIYPEAGRQTFGGAAVDSLLSSTGLSGGVSFAWTQQDPGGLGRQWTDLRFGIALPIPDVLYVGASGRYLQLAQTGTGPLGYSKASGGVESGVIIETITVDVGATLRPIPELVISVVGHNLTSLDTSLLPLMGAASIGFLTGEFSIASDVIMEATTFDTTKLRFQGGAEFLVANRVALRGGYRYDQGLDAHFITAGAGYVDPKFSIDLGARRSLTGTDSTTISFGFTVHMESLGLGAVSTEQ